MATSAPLRTARTSCGRRRRRGPCSPRWAGRRACSSATGCSRCGCALLRACVGVACSSVARCSRRGCVPRARARVWEARLSCSLHGACPAEPKWQGVARHEAEPRMMWGAERVAPLLPHAGRARGQEHAQDAAVREVHAHPDVRLRGHVHVCARVSEGGGRVPGRRGTRSGTGFGRAMGPIHPYTPAADHRVRGPVCARPRVPRHPSQRTPGIRVTAHQGPPGPNLTQPNPTLPHHCVVCTS